MAGFNTEYGYGRINARAAIDVGDILVFGSATVSATGGNGNGVIDFNECNDLSVTINNVGDATATVVSAILTSTTPGVTILQANSAYPNIPARGFCCQHHAFQS